MLMRNKGSACLCQSDTKIDHQNPHQALFLMDNHSSVAQLAHNSAQELGSNDESQRVKFLCSFLGSILPRPQDGKLRYVGGETRIVSVARDITYEELMNKMRELYEGATILKYQQPDEDLDALVSVVNDDDVTNMMEEYDKLGSRDGFTRLRIFLFSDTDQDGSPHFDGDDKDTESRYVDALNSLNDGSYFRKQQQPDSPIMSPVDEAHMTEQFLNQLNLDCTLHNQRNFEMLPHHNLNHLTSPPMGSGQHYQPFSQRYNEMEAPWSPAYSSPRHHGYHNQRSVVEFPSSPSSARYHVPLPDMLDKCLDRMPDKCLDRMPEGYAQPQVSHSQPAYEHQYSDNVAWLPTGTISSENSGFTGNNFDSPNAIEGSNICEHCRMTFHRSQPHFEKTNMGNGLHAVANPYSECPLNKDVFMLNADAKLHHGIYSNELNGDHRPTYSETQNHERGWILHQHLTAQVDEARTSVSRAGRLNDHYVLEVPGMTLPLGQNNMIDGCHMSSNYFHYQAGPELGTEVFHGQSAVGSPHLHHPPEESGVPYENLPYSYGGENLYPSHGHIPTHGLWRNVQNTKHAASSSEACASSPQVNGKANTAIPRGTREGNPRFCVGMDNQNAWVNASQKILGFDGKVVPEYAYGHALKLNPNALGRENQYTYSPESVQSPTGKSSFASPLESVMEAMSFGVKSLHEQEKEVSHVKEVESSDLHTISGPHQKKISDYNLQGASFQPNNSNCSKLAIVGGNEVKGERGLSASPDSSKLSTDRLLILPDLIASAKKAAIEGVVVVKTKVEGKQGSTKNGLVAKEAVANEFEPLSPAGDIEQDSHNDNGKASKIETTAAEAEAIAKGLQTIKNDDLEEIRELGSGTYGAVYHGKWRGSDVAIKRIKASCFAGRPSERERLIADFWKEALILSSLHHPNVVSFYGIVRDGPDGSLATLTEFMVNGSLKQFLQKKDRTIDRRKRLIIAMDAAFGMEYLHGKNIVHFDLKCENLLVNMRDPQRPVCKIGDLGLSKVKQHTLVSGGVRGTLPWMAPELLSGNSNMVSEKIDVYSFGVVMWELLTGEEPYADMHCASIIGGIVNNSLRPQIPCWCDPEWRALMESCWASDPAQRPSFAEISQKLRNMAAAMNVK